MSTKKIRKKISVRGEKPLVVKVSEVKANGAFFLLDTPTPIYQKDRASSVVLMPGDRVKVALKKGRYQLHSVLQRYQDDFVGNLFVKQIRGVARYVLKVDRKKMIDRVIYVDKNDLNGAKDKDKVRLKIVDWTPRQRGMLRGEVEKIFGKAGKHEVEMEGIVDSFHLKEEFPPEVSNQAKQLHTIPIDWSIREDFRDRLTFTIDPKNAKDFDDALSFAPLENGNYEVGVHVADVTHFIKKDDLLDKEAYQRSTSVYLVDRVIPMLPEVLSNDLCSLKPEEDRVAFSVIFEMNSQADIIDQKIVKTVIHSNYRLTYEQAQQALEQQEKSPLPPGVVQALMVLNRLAKSMRSKRFKSGGIDFYTSEIGFDLDKKGYPISVTTFEPRDSNKLIEDFMLLANKSVGYYIEKTLSRLAPHSGRINRVHEPPDPKKIEDFVAYAKSLGVLAQGVSARNFSGYINDISFKITDLQQLKMVHMMAIRTMSKAQYSPEKLGHYGLGFQHYTHFTSPIRRYPDMVTHRILMECLESKIGHYDKSVCYRDCVHHSDRERQAIDAERLSLRYMQVKYMQDKIDQRFEAIISGVTERGLYAEIISNRCEGRISVASLKDDYYDFDRHTSCLVGRNTESVYRVGQRVFIKVLRSDIVTKHIDMIILETKD